MSRTLRAAAAATILVAGAALAATPAQNCESGKNKEAGKYGECRQKAEATFALTGNATMRTLQLERCAEKYARRWPQLESRAGGACPSNGDQSAIQQYLDAASTDVTAALAGAPLAAQARPLRSGQTRCWNASSQAIPCAGTGQDGESQQGAARVYVDNGDGTITDAATGLMWEKLSNDTGIHDWDNVYTWENAFAQKIATLNLEGFAGYRDWRLPNVIELQSLIDYGTFGPAVSRPFHTTCGAWCTVLTCACTKSATYWSSSAEYVHPPNVWSAHFFYGSVDRSVHPTQTAHVRAVRGGS